MENPSKAKLQKDEIGPEKSLMKKKKKKTKMLEHALKTKLELREAYYPLQEPLS